ncbi:hypothetical protein M0638_28075 [Roseomonas sp. NAR14]|uniref:Uncharacterized protein n=1 Tax=Roseomonas acroporae TaxID=2937791 RepID=A0A9X1YE78_9PROT|nr:hypothetical protein [Roseomonas acroporae]MCK8788212.1 hypothetical protein [Roseomonas acroporae]
MSSSREQTGNLEGVWQFHVALIGWLGEAIGTHLGWMSSAPYPSDLNDAEWAILCPLLAPPRQAGLDFPLGSGGFGKEPEHPRRAV